MGKFIVGPDIIQRLYDVGLITEQPEYVSRVLFDFKAGHVGVMYIEKFADDESIEDKFAEVLLDAGLHVRTPGEEVERVGMHMDSNTGSEPK